MVNWRMDRPMNGWLWLAAFSLVSSALLVCGLAVVTAVKNEMDVIYCTALRAEHFLPCLPTGTGIASAAVLTFIGAVPIFALFSPLALMGSKRRDR